MTSDSFKAVDRAAELIVWTRVGYNPFSHWCGYERKASPGERVSNWSHYFKGYEQNGDSLVDQVSDLLLSTGISNSLAKHNKWCLGGLQGFHNVSGSSVVEPLLSVLRLEVQAFVFRHRSDLESGLPADRRTQGQAYQSKRLGRHPL